MSKGRVVLVGAGPGDTGLITIKGHEAIKAAEVILYDRLANPKLLEFAPSHCEFIYCGKLPNRHTLRQEKINELLVSKALEGKTVVRLKGGDPGVFGRVGEEAEALAINEIEYDIVPGISSGMAAPLYAGIPVTHREFGETFAVVTAHDKSKNGIPSLDWQGLASGIDTIAFYMGVANLSYICQNLIQHGKPATTPVILIQWGTFGRQKTLKGTLATIAEQAATVKFTNPAITLVGDIISLREKISWFERKPLFGRQILLARTGIDQSEITKELTDLGADVYEFPKWKKSVGQINPIILSNIKHYDQILFTSPESVTDFFDILVEQGIDIRQISATLFGASTKSIKALNKKGLLAHVESDLKRVEKLLVVGDNRYVNKYETSDIYVTSYMKIDEQFDQVFKLMFAESSLDTVIFPSSLSVEKLMQEMERTQILPRSIFEQTEIICMGQRTFQTAHDFGINECNMPQQHTKHSLMDYILTTRK